MRISSTQLTSPDADAYKSKLKINISQSKSTLILISGRSVFLWHESHPVKKSKYMRSIKLPQKCYFSLDS